MTAFNEPEWLKLLFLLSDTRTWINEMEKDLFDKTPVVEKRKLFRKTYYITAASLAHIVERHYYKIPRHPGAAKFTVSVSVILHWIREAYHQPMFPANGTGNHFRMLDTAISIGHDRDGTATTYITVITHPCGSIKTAFPGLFKSNDAVSSSVLIPIEQSNQKN